MALDGPHPPHSGSDPPGARIGSIATKRSGDAAPLAGDERLPCGRPLSLAWEQARDQGPATDPHTASCPYCTQAVEGLTALDRATLALRAQQRPSGRTLAGRVMDAVRAEVRIGPLLALDDPARDLQISETAATKVLRRAADTVPGSQACSCRVTPGEEGTGVHVSLSLASGLETPLHQRAQLVRRAVLRAADRRLGLAVAAVDVEIVDVIGRLHPLRSRAAVQREGQAR
ncbi:hypothetical protein [Streptomyces sp. NPDC048639]|uniref:hypothetical protein n=1 Tax=Streptomyces sp. NPDC048639 TaxID=3365581 RepID=UPI00372410D9